MSGRLENKKLVPLILDKEQRCRLGQEVHRGAYEGITCGGIVVLLNTKVKKAKLSKAEMLLGKGVVVEGKDVRCFL